MKSENLVDILKTGNIVIPIYFLKNYKKFDLKIDEFVFLMYLDSLKDRVFDPKSISNDLDIKSTEVMNYIGILSDKKLISIDTKKVDKNIVDIINLDGFYSKLGNIVKDNVNSNDVESSSIFELIEKEFGRTLSPIEYEIIKSWLEHQMTEELIREAVKEATFNGVSNLRYIDKILFEWGKKGIKTVQDVEKMRKKREKKDEKDVEIDMDLVDWNWFDEDE